MKTYILLLVLSAMCLVGCEGGSSSSGSSGNPYDLYPYDGGANTGGNMAMGAGANNSGDGYGGGGGGAGNTADIEDTHHTPEPATLVLLGSGLLGLAGYAVAKMRRRKH